MKNETLIAKFNETIERLNVLETEIREHIGYIQDGFDEWADLESKQWEADRLVESLESGEFTADTLGIDEATIIAETNKFFTDDFDYVRNWSWD